MNEQTQRNKSANKVMLVFTGTIIVLFLIVMFGWDAIRDAVTTTPNALLIFDALVMVTLMMLCVYALVIFYLCKLIKDYRFKKALPDKFWSPWGITKKVLALACVVLVTFLFITNLVNVVNDCNEGYEEVIYTVVKCESNDGEQAKFVYKEGNQEKSATCTLFDKIDWSNSNKYTALGKFGAGSGNSTFVFYKYKHSGLLLAVGRVSTGYVD